MIGQLFSASDLAAAKALIEDNGLTCEESFDEMFGAHENGELVATGARVGNILEMIAIAPSHQGGSLLGEMVTALLSRAFAAGHESVFVYTKSEYASSFEALNFKLLANQGKVVLLEYGKGLKTWLESKSALLRQGVNGAVVVNCNPFTNGHRYLIESAARAVDNLYVFVVKEERSVFPFADRMRLVADGVRDIGNAIVLDTSRYIVSDATFPTYFLKRDDSAARIQMELDVTLFASQIAPFFSISKRFAGSEPNCALTNAYNETMRRLLPGYGIDFVVVERKLARFDVISASRVRELLAKNELAELAEYVPETTLAFLTSQAAATIRERLAHDFKRAATV
jgi:[citrate (pro-3S)-lyase] ligase